MTPELYTYNRCNTQIYYNTLWAGNKYFLIKTFTEHQNMCLSSSSRGNTRAHAKEALTFRTSRPLSKVLGLAK